jgi:hypothetical protein
MLELRHEEKSIVVPFTLNRVQGKDQIRYNVIDSFYDKDGRDVKELGIGFPYEEWFIRRSVKLRRSGRRYKEHLPKADIF